MWAAGVAGLAALVAHWRIVGPGFVWLAASVVGGIGLGGWFLDPSPLLAAAAGAAWLAVVLGRKPTMATASLGAAAAAFVSYALVEGSGLLAVTGGLALGGVTAEMLLGHWYLVSPQMPRWALHKLAVIGAIGIVVDTGLLVGLGATVGVSAAPVVVFGVLAGMSLLLLVGVWFSLKQPSYPGVMAATGLSYLAVLTSLGATALGRTLLDGAGASLPFG
jgi:hypothetical protein